MSEISRDGLAAPTSAAMSASAGQRIAAAVGPVVAEHGLVIDDVAMSRAGNRNRLQIVVDLPEDHLGSADLDAVAEASRAISTFLDDRDDLTGGGAYLLEVTTPGADRPLTSPRHFRRARKRLVALDLADGRRVIGRLLTLTPVAGAAKAASATDLANAAEAADAPEIAGVSEAGASEAGASETANAPQDFTLHLKDAREATDSQSGTSGSAAKNRRMGKTSPMLTISLSEVRSGRIELEFSPLSEEELLGMDKDIQTIEASAMANTEDEAASEPVAAQTEERDG
ncbi:ribosome maturation factor RimP [Devriesea agamarum]|uniref:ribosome maturation factor RimP n=1 Tax=Devriesea agamarum TaxID=472569 RepID=UPI00071C67B4|nr:hypothetical protein [Devriesea agamarum]